MAGCRGGLTYYSFVPSSLGSSSLRSAGFAMVNIEFRPSLPFCETGSKFVARMAVTLCYKDANC